MKKIALFCPPPDIIRVVNFFRRYSDMLKLEMKLDIERIEQAQKYTSQAIQSSVDSTFGKYGFRKESQPDGTVCYYGTGATKDYGIFGRLITTLKDKDWFMPYVVKWLWYNSDDGEDENDFAVEDILLHYAGRESAA